MGSEAGGVPGRHICRTAWRSRRPGPAGNMTRAASKNAARPRRESRTTGSTGTGRKIATVERRKASVSVLLETRGAETRRLRAGHGTRYRVFAAPGAPVALTSPSTGVEDKDVSAQCAEGRGKGEERR